MRKKEKQYKKTSLQLAPNSFLNPNIATDDLPDVAISLFVHALVHLSSLISTDAVGGECTIGTS